MAKRIQLNTTAPDFELTDLNGNQRKPSSFRGQKNIILIFNRGFV